VIKVWGMRDQAGSRLGQFNAPLYTAVDKSGHIYVADTNNNRVQILDPCSDNITLLAPHMITGEPSTIAIHPVTADIFVGFTEDYVVVLTYQGLFKNNVTIFYWSLALFVDMCGYIYISDSATHSVHIYDPTWNITQTLGKAGSCRGCFKSLSGLTVNNKNGELLVADGTNNRIQVFKRQ
jgi:DNA-binding beta-propeller fold protein YncE